MSTLKKPETLNSLNPILKKSSTIKYDKINNMSSNLSNRRYIPIKAEHISDSTTVSYPEYPFLLYNFTDISVLQSQKSSEKYTLSNQFTSSLSNGNITLAASQSISTTRESAFRSTGSLLFSLGLAHTLYGGEYSVAAKNYLENVGNWEYWAELGSGKQQQYRDLGMAQMLFGYCFLFDNLYNDINEAQRSASLSTIYNYASQMEEAASKSFYSSSWLNWWAADYIQNHALTAFSSLGAAGLILKKENYNGWETIFNTAIDKLTRWQYVWNNIEDGTDCEGIAYQNTGYTNGLPCWEMLRKNGYNVTPEIHLKNYNKWLIYNHLTGSKQWLSSDADLFWNNIPGRIMYVNWYIANKYNDGTAQWVANKRFQSSFANNQDNRSLQLSLEYIFYTSSISEIDPQTVLNKYSVFKDWEGVVWRKSNDFNESNWMFSTRGGGWGGKWIQDNFAQRLHSTYPFEENQEVEVNYDHQHNDGGSCWLRFGNNDFIKEIVGYDQPYTSSLYHNTLVIDNLEWKKELDFHTVNITGSKGFMQDYANNNYANYVNFNQTKKYQDSQQILTASRHYLNIPELNLITCIDHISSSATTERNYNIRTHLGYLPVSVSNNKSWFTCSNGSDACLGINYVLHSITSGSNVSSSHQVVNGEGGDTNYLVSCSKIRSASFTNFVTNYYLSPNANFNHNVSSSILEENQNNITLYFQSQSSDRVYYFQNFIYSSSIYENTNFRTDAQTAFVLRSTLGTAVNSFFVHSGSELVYKSVNNIKLAWCTGGQFNGVYVKYLLDGSPSTWNSCETASIYVSSSNDLPNSLYISSSATYILINDSPYSEFTIPTDNTILITNN